MIQIKSQKPMVHSKSREAITITWILFGLFISALSTFIPALGSTSEFDRNDASKRCFSVQYKITRQAAENRGFYSSPPDIKGRNKEIQSNCSSLLKMLGEGKEIQRDFGISWELVKLISETPGGLSGFILDPEKLSDEIASGIDRSRINGMDDFISPVHNVRESCKNRKLVKSWQRVWGTQTPTADFTRSISRFCNRLDADYGQIMEAASRNLRTMMRQSHMLALKKLQELKSECEGMGIHGRISKGRAAQIRNSEVADIVSSFQFRYDPYKPSGGGSIMNNELQASLIGKEALAESLINLNRAADNTRGACAHALINQ